MKKQTFQSILCLFSGMIASLTFLAFMFYVLHWPGGHGMMFKMIPSLVAVLLLLLGIYVFRFGALSKLTEKGVYGAAHLQKTEGTAFLFIALLICGLVLRSMHIPGGAQLFLLSSFALVILSALASVWGTVILKEML